MVFSSPSDMDALFASGLSTFAGEGKPSLSPAVPDPKRQGLNLARYASQTLSTTVWMGLREVSAPPPANCFNYTENYITELAMSSYNNPDLEIPFELRKAHEEGRVVFFCGAGVSCNAGLPTFCKLAETIGKSLGNEYDRNVNPETFLMKLEHDFSPNLVRRACKAALTEANGHTTANPNLATHLALLRLAKAGDNTARDNLGTTPLRLVTTNFDNFFERAAAIDNNQSGDEETKSLNLLEGVPVYKAPLLPVPKNSRWNGLVHLHGALDERSQSSDLNELVLTSADFGRAYLTDRWAAHFISELFRNFNICFIGYSADDAIIRYMLDALNAEQMHGEHKNKVWVFADYNNDKTDERWTRKDICEKWVQRGVDPILFSSSNGYAVLHKKIIDWGESYAAGTGGKKSFIAQYAQYKPSEINTEQEDYLREMEWALWDETGKTATFFASLTPPPPLEWLFDVFSKKKYTIDDLPLLGFSLKNPRRNFPFGILDHPTSPDLAPAMNLVAEAVCHVTPDRIQQGLMTWLTRHMHDPRLIIWLSEKGGILNPTFHLKLEHQFKQFSQKDISPQNTLSQSPDVMPSKAMLTLWQMMLCGLMERSLDDLSLELYNCLSTIKQTGATTALRQQFRRLLAPVVKLSPPFREENQPPSSSPEVQVNDIVAWDICPKNKVTTWLIEDKKKNDFSWTGPLLKDIQSLLLDALELGTELDPENDPSYISAWFVPSLYPYPDGIDEPLPEDWTVYLVLLKEAWDHIWRMDRDNARAIAKEWFRLPYAVFKRLAFYAAGQNDCISPDIWSNWLLSENAKWLWSAGTEREVCRLLALQGQTLGQKSRLELLRSILKGNDSDPTIKNREYEIWHRLTILKDAGVPLTKMAQATLDRLCSENQIWRIAEDGRDELRAWTYCSSDNPAGKDQDIPPLNHGELLLLIRKIINGQDTTYKLNTKWRAFCKDKPLEAIRAIDELSKEDVDISSVLQLLLFAVDAQKIDVKFIVALDNLLGRLSDSCIQQVKTPLSFLLLNATKGKHNGETRQYLLKLCDKILMLPGSEIDGQKALTGKFLFALANHPAAKATSAIVNIWFQEKPQDNDGIPKLFKTRFSDIISHNLDTNQHDDRKWIFAQSTLAMSVIAFYRVDKDWTTKNLLPLFSWKNKQSNNIHAIYMWKTFLASPRWYNPLMGTWKDDFLECALHMDDLRKDDNQFARFMTFCALDISSTSYTIKDFKFVFEKFNAAELAESARALTDAAKAADKKSEAFWTLKAIPFFETIWPPIPERKSDDISEPLYTFIISLGDAFPQAVDFFRYRLSPLTRKRLHFLTYRLNNSTLCQRNPESAMDLLLIATRGETEIIPGMSDCLQKIKHANPDLERDERYQRLEKLSDQL